ncbi:transport protein particle component [Canariomyces notabilis]|uniref:Transport protein particle component n=1 Tax=Canariomyces notabilis TaxID=2074819 RepID=A0AAN6TJB2_9PEZI|nr:transport protein particle component [Canariomyces arenarius]
MSFEAVMPPYNASDPTARFLSSSCLDFLLIEIVPLAYRITNELEAGAKEKEAEANAAAGGLVDGQGNQGQGQGQTTLNDGAVGERTTSGGAAGTGMAIREGPSVMEEEEEREAVFWRLEGIGYRVGQGLVERWVVYFPYLAFVLWFAFGRKGGRCWLIRVVEVRFSRDRPRFNDTLDVIKFLCKDLWTLVFRKQVDNLKTNHRGVYVLTDNSFRPFSRMSAELNSQAVLRAQPFLWFPCGIVRGALAAMGITATVQAETTELPSAVFQIKTVPVKT